jgi:tRNA(Arg) A34 adenosine deaminase TadA
METAISIRYISIAKEEARISSTINTRHFHGAVGIYKNKIVSRAHNRRGSSWLQRLYADRLGVQKYCEHAEVGAIRKAKNIDTLLVVRMNKSESLINSRPCPICRNLIKDSGVKHLYYSNSIGEIEYERV